MGRNKFLIQACSFAMFVSAFQNCSKVDFYNLELASQQLETPTCTDLTADAVKPKLKWDWYSQLDLSKTENYPEFKQVMANPVVGDLNGDRLPEVVFVSWSKNLGYSKQGVLRIVDGATGATIRSIGEDSLAPFGTTTPLIIDIDGDGKAEISYIHHEYKSVITLNYDGSLRWIYTNDPNGNIATRRSFSAIDSDKNGIAEIIIGSYSLTEDASGNVIKSWQAKDQVGAGMSFAMNLNPAQPNVLHMVTSSGVYDMNGDSVVSAPYLNYIAADVDNTPGMELIGTGGARLKIIDAVTGQVKLDKDLTIHNDLNCGYYESGAPKIGGGPPTVGDFDGIDTTIEIAVATARYLTVFDGQGNIISKYETQDCSSLSTGISSFDFNGDGKPEILYGDEEYFRIFEMINGQLTVVWQAVNPSGTLNEYPVVVDIDGNRSSEILVVSNNYYAGSLYKDADEVGDQAEALNTTGVRAFESTGQFAWMPTRSVWNSYDFNPAFVTDNLRPVSKTNLDAFTAKMFRRNAQLGMLERTCQ